MKHIQYHDNKFSLLRSIPEYLRWLSDISWYRYGYEGLLINQWYGVDMIPCNKSIPCPMNGLTILAEQGYSPVSNIKPCFPFSLKYLFFQADFSDCVMLLGLIAVITTVIPLLMLLYRGSHDE